MNTRYGVIAVTISCMALAACNQPPETPVAEGRKVEASGKEEAGLESVPEAVLAAVRAARPDLEITVAEYETRDGNEYYDVGGLLPDGSELELDTTKLNGVWTVVEVQRDIPIDIAPAVVVEALAAHAPEWAPTRIIESDQGDGVVVYEFFGPGQTDELLKIEVKFADGAAEVLVDEWAH